jgi:hypothetical protein
MIKRLMISVAALSLLASAGIASAKQEVQVTRTVWELSDFPELAAKAKAICEGSASLSDKLKIACKANEMPKVSKSGTFRNTGIGAELNTLIRQQAPVTVPTATSDKK